MPNQENCFCPKYVEIRKNRENTTIVASKSRYFRHDDDIYLFLDYLETKLKLNFFKNIQGSRQCATLKTFPVENTG